METHVKHMLVDAMLPFVDVAIVCAHERLVVTERIAELVGGDLPDVLQQTALLHLVRAAVSWHCGDLADVGCALPKAMLEAVHLGERHGPFWKACGRLSHFVTEAPILNGVLDTSLDMSGNREYFEAMARADPVAWRIAAFESVLRCLAQRRVDIHRLRRIRETSCMFRWDGDASEELEAERARFVIQDPATFKALTITPLLTDDGHRAVHCARSKPSPRAFLEQMTYGLLTPAFFQRHPELVAAGGSVTAACLSAAKGYPACSPTRHGHDLDLFLVGVRDHAEAAEIVRATVAEIVAWSNVDSNIPHVRRTACLVSVTRNSVNCSILCLDSVYGDAPLLFEVQIVMRLFRSVEELLLFFDFGACRFAYDGATFICTDSALYAAANGAYFLEPAMMTYPKRVIKYFNRGFVPRVPITPGYLACLLSVMHADRERLLAMTHLKTLVSLLAFTHLAVVSSARRDVSVRAFVRKARTDESDAPCAGISGDVHKPLMQMAKACYPGEALWGDVDPDAVENARFVCRMRAEQDMVWECFEKQQRRPADQAFRDASEVETVLRERLDLWKLDKPCVNLIVSDPCSSFFRTA